MSFIIQSSKYPARFGQAHLYPIKTSLSEQWPRLFVLHQMNAEDYFKVNYLTTSFFWFFLLQFWSFGSFRGGIRKLFKLVYKFKTEPQLITVAQRCLSFCTLILLYILHSIRDPPINIHSRSRSLNSNSSRSILHWVNDL